MRRIPALVLLALSGCAPALWESTARLDSARLFVPRSFAPLVAGSIYPDRSRPEPSRGLPGVLVLTREMPARAFAEPLGRRGLVALVARFDADPAAALALLRARPEAGGPVALLVEAPAPLERALALPGLTAAVVAGDPGPLPASHPPLLVLRSGTPSGPALAGVSERWYATRSGRLSPLAFQDAADWLCERLGSRPCRLGAAATSVP